MIQQPTRFSAGSLSTQGCAWQHHIKPSAAWQMLLRNALGQVQPAKV